ncbi:hypothetical protein GCM10023339_18100 [Alloalcanivorax gelatiniphagus]
MRVSPRALAAVRVPVGLSVGRVVVMGTTLVVGGLEIVGPRHGPGVGRRAEAARSAYDLGRTDGPGRCVRQARTSPVS